MADDRIDPLAYAPISEKDGRATHFFARQWQNLVTLAQTTAKAAQDALDALASIGVLESRQVNAGTGLTGGGPLSSDVTIDLADTAVTPATYGDATNVAQVTIDQQGRITAAANVAVSCGGGGGGLFSPPLSTDFPTIVAGGSAAATVTDDANAGLVMETTAGALDNAYMILKADAPPVSGTSTYVYGMLALLPTGSTPAMGFCLRNTANSRRLQIGFNSATIQNHNVAIAKWPSDTAFNAAVNVLNSFRDYSAFFRLDVTSAGDITAYFGLDGYVWKQFSTTTLANYIGTYDQIGFVVTAGNGTNFPTMSVPYYVKT